MNTIIKWTGTFFVIILAGFGVAWLFANFVANSSSDITSSRGKSKSGMVQLVQQNRQIGENTYPRLNDIIKENRKNLTAMKEKIEIAYRGLPLMETTPRHGTIVRNNTSGPIVGILAVDTSNTPDFDTLVTLSGQGNDKFGNAIKICAMVRGGEYFEIPVPEGIYSIEFSSGVAWFGLQNLFGPLTDRLATNGTYSFGPKNMGYEATTYPNENADFQISGIKIKDIPKRDRAVREKIDALNQKTP